MDSDMRASILVFGSPLQVKRFLVICKTIQKLCQEGSSRTVSFDVDGDGSSNIKFNIAAPGLGGVEAVDTNRDPVRLPGINDY
jgi:hypothetical protein